jgi:hypothetical protein
MEKMQAFLKAFDGDPFEAELGQAMSPERGKR